MSDPRPIAPAPNIDAIPAELIARAQWVVWCYALDKNGKWTKVPYTPGTTDKASHSRPSTWRSFTAAVACYHERPDFFDGIGYVFSKDDPYVGGDIDHDLSTDRIPATYAEISPSGTGIKFIAHASGDYGRKTKRGELYSEKRFFTITGNVLPGHETITSCQEGVEAFAASLGTASTKAIAEGTAGTGSRAELVKLIPASEWEAGRHLLRTQINRLLARVRAAAKEETQLAYLLRGEYAGFHQKWSFVGLYRGDGTLDESQVRAVAATGIKGRGFTFPEYVALMSHLYGAKALAKWGAKERWREELAALWYKAAGPRYAPKPAPKIKAPRGRAGDHQALVERVYQLLQEHRAGAQAIVQIGDIAEAIGTHRRTVTTILNELRAKDRISTKRHGQYGGLIITFSDVIYSAAPEPVQPTATRQTEPATTHAEETKISNCVSSETREADHISEPQPPRNLREAVALVLAQVDRGEFGRGRLKAVRDTLAVLYGYTDLAVVNKEIRTQESIFGKERRDCWRMAPDGLIARVEARTKSATRNVGKRQEGKYRKLLEIANEVRAKRGIAMPEKPVKQKAVKPTRPPRPIAEPPPLTLAMDLSQPTIYTADYLSGMVERLRNVKVQVQHND